MSSGGSDTYEAEVGGSRIRRGSEGYEVRPTTREEMLERYLLEQGMEPGRYQRYVPEPDIESDGTEDELPLSHFQRVQ